MRSGNAKTFWILVICIVKYRICQSREFQNLWKNLFRQHIFKGIQLHNTTPEAWYILTPTHPHPHTHVTGKYIQKKIYALEEFSRGVFLNLYGNEWSTRCIVNVLSLCLRDNFKISSEATSSTSSRQLRLNIYSPWPTSWSQMYLDKYLH